jgi:hypothetical protein
MKNLPPFAASYFLTIAREVEPNLDVVKIAMLIYGEDISGIITELLEATEQGYAGYNIETGDWCRKCLEAAITYKFEYIS